MDMISKQSNSETKKPSLASSSEGLSILEVVFAASILALTFLYLNSVGEVNNKIIRKSHGMSGIMDIEQEIVSTVEMAAMNAVHLKQCGNWNYLQEQLNRHSDFINFEPPPGDRKTSNRFPCPSSAFGQRGFRFCQAIKPTPAYKDSNEFLKKYEVIVTGAYYFKQTPTFQSYTTCDQITPETEDLIPFSGDFFFSLMVYSKADKDNHTVLKRYRHMRLDNKFLRFVSCLYKDYPEFGYSACF